MAQEFKDSKAFGWIFCVLILVVLVLLVFVFNLTTLALSPQELLTSLLAYLLTTEGMIVGIIVVGVLVGGIIGYVYYSNKSAWGIKRGAVKDLKSKARLRIKEEL